MILTIFRSAAAFSNNNTNHRGYKDNFFFGIALTGVTLVMVCKYISGRSLKCCKAVITKTDTLQVTALAVVLTVLRMVLLAGGFVGLIMGFYLAFARSSKTVSSGRIFGSFAITALCYGALAYLRKYKRPQLRKSTVSLKADSTGFFVRSFIKYVWGSAFYSFTHFYRRSYSLPALQCANTC